MKRQHESGFNRQTTRQPGLLNPDTRWNRISWFWLFLALGVKAALWYFSSRTGSQSQVQSDTVLNLFSLPDIRLFSVLIRKSAHFLSYAAMGAAWFLFFHSGTDPVSSTPAAPSASSKKTRFKQPVPRPIPVQWKKTGWLKKKGWLPALLCSGGYAILDELHQHFVPGRSGQWQDVCLDSLGAAAGIFLAISFFSLRDLQRKTKK